MLSVYACVGMFRVPLRLLKKGDINDGNGLLGLEIDAGGKEGRQG